MSNCFEFHWTCQRTFIQPSSTSRIPQPYHTLPFYTLWEGAERVSKHVTEDFEDPRPRGKHRKGWRTSLSTVIPHEGQSNVLSVLQSWLIQSTLWITLFNRIFRLYWGDDVRNRIFIFANPPQNPLQAVDRTRRTIYRLIRQLYDLAYCISRHLILFN